MVAQAVRIAVVAGKGGVGKTTSVINLGAAFAAIGHRCLVVDCDPQSNLTSGLGLDPYQRRLTVADVVVGRCDAARAVVETSTPGLHLLPAHPDLSAVEAELPTQIMAVLRLRDALEALAGGYDVVLLDTPPNFGFHTLSALAAARYVMVPLQMSAFALRGLKEVIRVVSVSRRGLNAELELLGVAPTFVSHTRFSRDLLEALADMSRVRLFRSQIAMTVRLQESALQGLPVLVSAPSSPAARAYAALADEVAEATELAPPSPARVALTLADLATEPGWIEEAILDEERVLSGHHEWPGDAAVEERAAQVDGARAAIAVADPEPVGGAALADDVDADWLTLIQAVREQPAAAAPRPRRLRLRLRRRGRPAA